VLVNGGIATVEQAQAQLAHVDGVMVGRAAYHDPYVLHAMDVALHGGDTRHNIEPFSLMSWLLWSACWAVTGLYATVSWRRGGQTLGMRPWRLRLRTADGAPPSWRALWLRYAVGTLSLLAGGLGVWWAWFDRGRLAWHDRASGTGLERLPKRKK